MKTILIFFALLVAATMCDDMSSFRFTDGKMEVNSTHASKIDGKFYYDDRSILSSVGLSGVYVNGGTKTPFDLNAVMHSFEVNGENFVASAHCSTLGWGPLKLKKLSGNVTVEGVINNTATFKGTCVRKNGDVVITYTFAAHGKYSKKFFYTPIEAARRAPTLVGEKGYKGAQVLSFAILGYPFYDPKIMDCGWYSDFLHRTPRSQPGYVVVGTDEKHCGIVDAEGDKFVQANPITLTVTLTPMIYLNKFFPKGYKFLSY